MPVLYSCNAGGGEHEASSVAAVIASDVGPSTRPRLVVSKCLGFAHCRYNGAIMPDAFVEKLAAHVDFLPICPEIAIGLGVRRDPIRIIENQDGIRLCQPLTGRDVTHEMRRFVDAYLEEVSGVDGFLLKGRSPSCGLWDVKVFAGLDSVRHSRRGSGFFGGEVLKLHSGLALEDEGRLKNFSTQEHFFTRLFLLAAFRGIRRIANMSHLADFHTRNKLLLMGYGVSRSRHLGSVVANREGRALPDVFRAYEAGLQASLARPPRHTAMIDVLRHALGGSKLHLKPEEKSFFLSSVEQYRDKSVPLSVPVHLLKAWSIAQDNRYLLGQSLLEPYPALLIEITNSAKVAAETNRSPHSIRPGTAPPAGSELRGAAESHLRG